MGPEDVAVTTGSSRVRQRAGLSLLLALFVALSTVVPAGASDGDQAWLERLNEVRANAGLGSVVERADWSRAATEHARYLVQHGILEHGQDPTLAGASAQGTFAARTGNLYGASFPATPTRAMQTWINSPRHARWLFRPGLREVGFGDHTDTTASPYQYGAVLPVVEGIDRSVAGPARITFPGDGSTLRTRATEGEAAAFRALYLFREDLLPADGSGARVRVEVEGQGWPVADVQGLDGMLAVLLDRPLPPEGAVEVEVRFADRPDDGWRFRLGSGAVTSGPRTADSPPATAPADGLPFTDVAGSAHRRAIVRIAEAGLVGGYDDRTFRPGNSVTRGQLASILADLFDRPGPTSSIRLTDAANSVHAAGIAVAIESGWMSVRPDGTFRPSEPVTRGELAATLTAALDLDIPPASAVALSDVGGTAHADGIRALVVAGLAGGYPDGTFRPAQEVTRGQVATVLVGVLDRG